MENCKQFSTPFIGKLKDVITFVNNISCVGKAAISTYFSGSYNFPSKYRPITSIHSFSLEKFFIILAGTVGSSLA